MRRHMHSWIAAIAPATVLALGGLLTATLSTSSTSTRAPWSPVVGSSVGIAQDRAQEQLDPIRILINQIDELNLEILELRQAAADAQLRAARAEQQLSELQQFIADNDQYGRDFEEYERVKAIAEQEARQRELERIRAQRAAAEAEKRERMREARAERDRRREQQELERTYREAGFTHLGQAVLLNRMSYNYQTTDQTRSRVDYEPGIGHYERLYPNQGIDFSTMTISGSVLNAAPEVRNIGVAITFFDRRGNQVGHEIVQIRNARPDVPYPFTSTIDMALDRPFATSSQYVLYADPVSAEDEDSDG